ncbi:MAG TPA: hypothetical protein VLJ59_00935 [Mycobacteriales bacterium]|nr:hypothetical protein [Mycobacteriales bacterium]
MGAPSGRSPATRLTQLGAVPLGLSLAATYLVVSALVGVALLSTSNRSSGAGLAEQPVPAPATYSAVPTTGPATPSQPSTSSPTDTLGPTTPVESQPPPGYRQVFGPLGLSTYLPSGWLDPVETSPGVIQVGDPGDNGPDNSGRFLRYGGTATASADMLSDHVRYEREFTTTHPGFHRVRLEPTTHHGLPAVDWEFEWVKNGVRRHVHSLYWRNGGNEYFVYASARAQRWNQTTGIYAVMVDGATP